MSTLHAWDCPCGTRNAPQFAACRNCKKPQVQGKAVYAVTPPAPAPATASVSPEARREIPTLWLVLAAVCLLFVFGSNYYRKVREEEAPKRAAALRAFSSVVSFVMADSPGVITGMGWEFDAPVLKVTDRWYRVPVHMRIELTDNAGNRWHQCCVRAGLKGHSSLYVQDAGGNLVATYSSSSGAKLQGN